MYADDIALISDTITGFKRQLNLLAEFCDSFKLKVKEIKTKVLVFLKKGGVFSKMEKWIYKDTVLEVVNGFTYFVLLFPMQLSFVSG